MNSKAESASGDRHDDSQHIVGLPHRGGNERVDPTAASPGLCGPAAITGSQPRWGPTRQPGTAYRHGPAAPPPQRSRILYVSGFAERGHATPAQPVLRDSLDSASHFVANRRGLIEHLCPYLVTPERIHRDITNTDRELKVT